jgi:hypothetical protein
MNRTIPFLGLVIWVSLAHCVTAEAFTPGDFDFEQENKATATVSVSIQSLPDGRELYSYGLTNSLDSERAIFLFAVQVDTAGVSMGSPSGWSAPGCCIRDNTRKSSTGIQISRWIYDQDSALVAPGRSLSGYTLSALALPGVGRFFVQSFTDKETPEFEGGDSDAEAYLAEVENFFNNSTSGLTLVPETAITTDIGALIDRLIGLKHQTISIGWLADAEFAEKLDRRLDEAKSALASGKKKLARVRMTQFVHDLAEAHGEHGDSGPDHGKDKEDHRREKFVNDAAFQLLKINADFIIAKLPTEAKDKDEEEECRRAEGEPDGNHGRKGTDD